MRVHTVALIIGSIGLSAPAVAEVPSAAAMHADPIAAFQGVWESRFCSKQYQWKVEGRTVKMHRRDTSPDASPYDNRHAIGAPVMILEGPWDQSDRGVRLYAAFVDPSNGYQSRGSAAALTTYTDQYGPYIGFNEMIREDVKQRQCGTSAAKPTPTKADRRAPSTPPVAARPDTGVVALAPQAPRGPTPNQLKYQRELAEYQARLAEIEKIKTDTATKHAGDTAAAAAELARHQRELAVADAARKRHEADLAAHQRLIRDRETKQDREAKVDWREGVSVCVLNPADGQAKFGNWRCDGPLQMNYAKLGNPGQAASAGALAAISMTCGGRPESVRDLGMVGDAHLFGCSYGLHPQSRALDPVAKHGIGFVPGRAIYRCPLYVSSCRTQ